MKTISIFAIVICILALILDIAGAFNAAINHNLESLCHNLLLAGLMIFCLKINFETYKRIKNNKHETGE